MVVAEIHVAMSQSLPREEALIYALDSARSPYSREVFATMRTAMARVVRLMCHSHLIGSLTYRPQYDMRRTLAFA